MKQRIISIITTLAMCLSISPTWAYAEEVEVLPDAEETWWELQEKPDPPNDEPTEGAVVSVTIDGTTTYYGTFDGVWNAVSAEGVTSAEITLLADVTRATLLPVSPSMKITLNGGKYTLSVNAVQVFDGQLDISSGTFEFINGGALMVSGGTVQLSGGEFTSTTGKEVIFCSPESNLTVGDLLGEGYAYFDEAGKPIEMTGQTVLEGTVTVKEFEHEGVTPTQTTTAPTL